MAVAAATATATAAVVVVAAGAGGVVIRKDSFTKGSGLSPVTFANISTFRK